MKNKQKLFLDALDKKYCACMFDFDGTLTERRSKSPVPDSLKETLRNLSAKIPMAICTARPFSTAYPKLQEILGGPIGGSPLPGQFPWVLIAENGCAGYYFNKRKNDWSEFYRVKWPNKFINKKVFANKVYDKLRGQIGDYPTAFQINDSSLIFQPSYDNADGNEVIRRCDVLEIGIKKILRRLKNGRTLKAINSKLGIIIIPRKADKDRGIEEFGKYLTKNFGKKFGRGFAATGRGHAAARQAYKEIVVVGDQPGKGGNDEMFLSSRVGTPFTAGEILKTKYPIGIFDKSGSRLTGPEATEYLLKSLKFC